MGPGAAGATRGQRTGRRGANPLLRKAVEHGPDEDAMGQGNGGTTRTVRRGNRQAEDATGRLLPVRTDDKGTRGQTQPRVRSAKAKTQASTKNNVVTLFPMEHGPARLSKRDRLRETLRQLVAGAVKRGCSHLEVSLDAVQFVTVTCISRDAASYYLPLTDNDHVLTVLQAKSVLSARALCAIDWAA